MNNKNKTKNNSYLSSPFTFSVFPRKKSPDKEKYTNLSKLNKNNKAKNQEKSQISNNVNKSNTSINNFGNKKKQHNNNSMIPINNNNDRIRVNNTNNKNSINNNNNKNNNEGNNNNFRNINNIDNNISYSNFPGSNKDVLSSGSINNFEDMDEKLDIRLPYNINNNITHSIIKTQGNQTINFNFNNYKYFNGNINSIKNNNETDIYNYNEMTNTKKTNTNNAILMGKNNFNNLKNAKNENLNGKNEDYNEKYFNTFSQINSINKGNNLFHVFQNVNGNIDGNNSINRFSLQNNYNNINNNNTSKINNINVERNLIVNRKKYKNNNSNSVEEKEIENENLNKNNYYDNYFLNNGKRNIVKSIMDINSNVSFENNKIFMPLKGSSNLFKNENKEILNFSNNNKKKFSVTKKDLKHFYKNEHYIQKIMENLPQSKNKKIKNINNFNQDHRKYKSRLNNKDNNVDYYNNNRVGYNNYFKKDLNSSINNNNSVNNNSVINNENINNIKTVRGSRYLSVGKVKVKSFIDKDYKDINKNDKNENQKINDNNQHHHYQSISSSVYKYNYTPKRGGARNDKKSKKYISSVESLYFSIKIKNYNEFFFNVCNRKFKHLFVSFLDVKTILNVSSVNSIFYKNTRDTLYTYFYDHLLMDKNNKDKYIRQILNSAKKYCSDIIKTKEIKYYYRKLLKKNEMYDDIILKDLPRTIPNDISFNIGKINYHKLYNILTCYSNYNKKIGYAQGLNFICAQAIYLFSSEEEVFLFVEGFINIMKMDNLIGVENEKKMLYKLNEFSNILYKYVPKIIQFFEEKSVSHDFFSTGWILTLFSSSMERSYLVIIWCFMIIFRWKFVYAFIIQALKRYERNITNVEEGQLCFVMKNFLRTKEFKNDFNNIIKDTLNFMKNNVIL